MEQKKRENVPAGIVGAFLGSLIGVACAVLIGQLGYVASVSGLVMAVCALKGYELLGGSLTKKGALISSLLILVMTYLAHRLIWAVALADVLHAGIFEAFQEIPELLDRGRIESGPYWGDLIMLYLFTLLGAVPTIWNGLKSTEMPDLPPVRTAAEASGALEEPAVFYPGVMKWTRGARFSASLSMMPGLLLGLALLVAAIQQDGLIPLSMAALACVLSSFVMVCAAAPLISLGAASTFVFVKAAGTLWRVNLMGLNRLDTYRFSKKTMPLRGMRWEILSPEEQAQCQASVQRAISLLTSGQIPPGSNLSLMVLPLTDLEITKENKWCWKGTYSGGGGKRKKVTIAKAYPDFAPAPGMERCQEPMPWRTSLLAAAVVLALAAGAAGFVGGQVLDGALQGPSTAAPGRQTEPWDQRARVPENTDVYLLDQGVAYEIDSSFRSSSGNSFYDTDTHTDYTVSVQYGADEEVAVAVLVDLISAYRTSSQYDGFQFAHAGEGTTLVPMTAADGKTYQYEIMSLRFKDGKAIHMGVALAEGGTLITVRGQQRDKADENVIKGNILYILESVQLSEITPENYRELYHQAAEMGYQYIGAGYVKAPEEMFGHEAFVDVYVPYSENPEFLNDGYALRSRAHGMEVTVTMTQTDGDARDAVAQVFEELSGRVEIDLEGVAEVEYVESYDIALQRVVYMDGGKSHIALLYADYKQEGYYLSAQIVYLLDQQDEAYPTLLAELGDVFALNLPEIDPFE